MITDLLAILSMPGSIAILELAKDGINADTKPQSLGGITKKQYGLRLAKLERMGLIEKRRGRYLQTPFGRALWQKYIPRFEVVLCPPRRRYE